MSKERNTRKDEKKKPQKTQKEKRREKQEKRKDRTRFTPDRYAPRLKLSCRSTSQTRRYSQLFGDGHGNE